MNPAIPALSSRFKPMLTVRTQRPAIPPGSQTEQSCSCLRPPPEGGEGRLLLGPLARRGPPCPWRHTRPSTGSSPLFLPCYSFCPVIHLLTVAASDSSSWA